MGLANILLALAAVLLIGGLSYFVYRLTRSKPPAPPVDADNTGI